MPSRPVHVVSTDGSAASADALSGSLGRAIDGTGPAVLPLGPGDAAPDPALTEPVDDDVAVLVATSGSTGTPKAVLLGSDALRASAEATRTRLAERAGAGTPMRWLLPLPAHHVAGVQVLLRSRHNGDPAAVLDLRAGFRPDAFAAAVTEAAATGRPVSVTSLVPTQLVRLLDDAGAGLEALRGLDAVLLGGAAAPEELLARARAAGVAVVTTYGMSETCGGCVYDGVPLDGVRVALDDPAPDGSGRIRLGGATLARGYRSPDPALPAAFSPDGWFRTSDLGRWSDDGRLEVLGRADDVIVSGGEKVAPARVERALLAVPGVRDACVVGVPDPEWGARVVAAVVGEVDPEKVRRDVAAELDRAAPREIRVVAALPLHGIGKPDRAAVTRLFSG